jgi:hypothetical protein
MKIYDTLNVELSYQNCGSQWLIVLAGKEEEIELAFNGCYNLCATSGDLRFTDHTRSTATFWSKEKNMRRFFYNLNFLRHSCDVRAQAFSDAKMLELTNQSVQFFDFTREVAEDGFVVGSNKAERPDIDFRDAVLNHSFKDKTSVKDVEKMLDN